jgi:heme-degrading monooxygenase HmoA
MYARVTRVGIKVDNIEDAIRRTDQEISPELEKDQGFKGFYVLGNRESGDSLVITMWETHEAEEASRPKVAQRFGMLGEYLSGEPEPSSIYEVMHANVPAKEPAV